MVQKNAQNLIKLFMTGQFGGSSYVILINNIFLFHLAVIIYLNFINILFYLLVYNH